MPSAQSTLPSSAFAPFSSFSSSSVSVQSLSSSSLPPSRSLPSAAMEHSHQPHWHLDPTQHTHTHSLAPLHDRARKDPDMTHPDPYHSHHRAHGPPPAHHSDSQHQHPPQQRLARQYSPPPPSQHYHSDSSGYRQNGEQSYGRQGHRYSTDSAAADTLLMLSAAAFMDPTEVQSVMASEVDRRMPSQDHYSTGGGNGNSYPYHTHTTYHNQRRYSPPSMERSRLPLMSKTISAPASSSTRPPLPSLVHQSRLHNHHQDVDMEPRPLSPPCSSNKHPAASSDRRRKSLQREPEFSPVESARFSASRSTPPNLLSSAALAGPSSTLISISSNGSIPTKDDLRPMHSLDRRRDLDEVEDDDEEEDEVMSEGVVHVNAMSAPNGLSPQGKTRSSNRLSNPFAPLPPSISTSATFLHNEPGSQHQLDSPRTPTSARTPRTPKQTKAPKLPKAPRVLKRSQSDYQGSSHGAGRGKKDQRDYGGDYFFSPFPPSASPASSPSSPSSFQAQLQMLTHNFVSVQPHADPTSRFRHPGTPSLIASAGATATPPFSPPVSPGTDLIRDSPFHLGSVSSSTTSSPTKNGHGASVPTTPTLTSFLRSPSGKPTTPVRSHFKPRWHTQPFMMFLALRAMPDRTAARQELIMAAVELDKKLSAEKGLPRVFTGKTPMNSASACLTNNGDKYFIPFKPEGSRSTHFQLAYQVGDFDTSVKEYDGWMEQLIQRDWPLCFGIPKDGAAPLQGFGKIDELVIAVRPEIQRAYSSPESRKRGPDLGESEQELDSGTIKKVKAESDGSESEDFRQDSTESCEERKVADRMERLDIKAAGIYDGSMSCPPTPTAATLALTRYSLHDLNLEDVPKRLSDIVHVDVSTVPNAGNGLFAKIDVPAGTPIGFYFGVPMTENEFDSLKDGVGLASQYSIMYQQRTVLDATNEQGMPHTDPQGRLYCPFHFMNEDSDGNVSLIAGTVTNQVICMTNRDVKAGEELFVFHGKEIERNGHGGAFAAGGSISAAAALTFAQGHDIPASGEGADGRRSRAGSKSRASSPVKRAIPAEDLVGGRPRRETVSKPARYTR